MESEGRQRRRLFSSSTQPDVLASPRTRTRSFSGLTTLSRRLREEQAEVKELEQATAKALQLEGKPVRESEYLNAKQRVLIFRKSLQSPKVRSLMRALLQWVNLILGDRRVLVNDVSEDFFDGQVLTEMLEELEGNTTLFSGGLPLSADQQRSTLQRAVSFFESQYKGEVKWSVEAIRHRDIVETTHLLVAMARHYRCPVALPRNVRVEGLYAEEHDDELIPRRRLTAQLTEEDEPTYSLSIHAVPDEDVFDHLFNQSPKKVAEVENSLIVFVNRHLNKVGVSLHCVERQFADGVNFIYLMSLAEDFFVPLCAYNICPYSDEQKLANMRLVFELLGQSRYVPSLKMCTPELIVQGNLKATLRLLYILFQAYQGVGLVQDGANQLIL